MEDEETGVVSTVEVPDLMEEDERGSFGNPDQGVVLNCHELAFFTFFSPYFS